MTLSNLVLILTATLTALMAGLFYAWSCSVMPGFARLRDREFVGAMQSANRAIQNPVFFAAFFGAPVFLIISVIWHYDAAAPRFWLLLAATIVYIAGNFGVTVAGNVPLNNRLESFNSETATDEETARQRAGFERRWNNLNHIRSVASTVALVMVIIACLS